MKRILTAILCLMLVLCMTTASALVLRPGDKGTNVSALQQALNATGYYHLNVDGKYGAATTSAVKDFQARAGLKVDGKAGPQTLTALGFINPVPSPSAGTVLKVGSTGPEVLALQQALVALGYPVGTCDAKYGAKTYRAVILFQQINAGSGLKVDGKAGPATQAVLYSGSALPYSGTPSTGKLTALTLSNNAPHVNETVVAYTVPAGVNATFTWYREDGKQLGTGAAYTVKAADENTRIYCVATGNGSVSSLTSSVITKTAADAAKKYLTGTVVLPSEIAVDAVLTPNIYLNPDRSDLYYTWYVGGIMTASTKTLKITAPMVGKDVRLVIKCQDETIEGSLSSNICVVRHQTTDSMQGGTGDGYTNVIKTLYGFISLPAEAEISDVLSPDVSQLNYTENLVYSWYQNGQFIGSYKTLKVTEAMVGKDIHVVVSPAANSGYQGNIGSNYTHVKTAVQGTKTLLQGTVTINTRADVGSVVTATLGLNTTDVTYNWTVDGLTVSTKSTCQVTEDMAGKKLYCTVTAKTDSTYFGSVTSDKCECVLPVNP